MIRFRDSIPYLISSAISMRWTIGSGSVTANVGGGRWTGGNSIQIPGAGGAAQNWIKEIINDWTTGSTYFVQFAYKYGSGVAGSSNRKTIIEIGDAGGAQGALILIPNTGALRLYRGSGTGTLLATSTSLLAPDVYHHIVLKLLPGSSSGVIEVKVDNVVFATFTGNTQGSGTTNCTYFQTNLKNDSFDDSAVDICDALAYDASDTVNNNYLGDKKVQPIFANGPGDVAAWTRNFAAWAANTAMSVGQQVSDGTYVQRVTSVSGDAKTGGSAPSWNSTVGGTTTDNHVTWTNKGALANWIVVSENPSDGDQSYNSTTNVGDADRFAYPAITGSGIVEVAETVVGRKDDAGTNSFRGSANSGGTVGDSGTDIPLPSAFAYLSGPFPRDPNTSALWTATAVNAANIGYKRTA